MNLYNQNGDIHQSTFQELNEMLDTQLFITSKKFILTDENTRKQCLPILLERCQTLQNAEIIEIPSGERYKNPETFLWIIEQLSFYHADRQSVLINLGGGVICDTGGFAAACYKRGIDFINIPTSLLAMIDAAYGGKTGVNFRNFKNQIGIFAQARAVIVEADFLKTLPKSEILSGFAEMIKMALITSDDFWTAVKRVDLTHLETLNYMIFNIINRKNQIVKDDPTEQHIRKVLNFGHTFGHAFETFAMQTGQELSHGHAVAMGMICELWLSEHILGFPADKRREISGFIESVFPKFLIQISDFECLTNILLHDKKNREAQIRPILLEQVGFPQYHLHCTKRQCLEAFQAYTTIPADV